MLVKKEFHAIENHVGIVHDRIAVHEMLNAWIGTIIHIHVAVPGECFLPQNQYKQVKKIITNRNIGK